MSQIIFQVKIWWVEKISRNKIGEIKKFYEKNFDREKFIKWKKQKMYIQIKNSANTIFFKKFCIQIKAQHRFWHLARGSLRGLRGGGGGGLPSVAIAPGREDAASRHLLPLGRGARLPGGAAI